MGVEGIQKGVGESGRTRGSGRGSGGPGCSSPAWLALTRTALQSACDGLARAGASGFRQGEEEESALDRGLRGREAEQCGAPTTSSVCAQFRGSGCRASEGRKAWEERLQSRSYARGSVQGLRRPMLYLLCPQLQASLLARRGREGPQGTVNPLLPTL